MLFGRKKEDKRKEKEEKEGDKAAKEEKPSKPAKQQEKASKRELSSKMKSSTEKAASEEVAPDVEAPPRPPLKPSEIRERLDEGWLKALITFELVGKPREHVEQTIRAYAENIKNEPRIVSLHEEYAAAMEHEDGMFSTFVEMEALVKDLETLTWIAINFMPASIEIEEPHEHRVEARAITNWFNDLLSKLHEVSNTLRTERGINAHLTEGMNALIKNIIVAALRDGAKDEKEIAKIAGIPEEQLAPFLKHLLDKKKIVQKGKDYALP